MPSRRLGRSLGIDLVPFKTCTYDCVYCQLGRTTDKTVELKEYIPVVGVLEELDRKLAEGDKPDFITLAGSGEPTLYSGLGRLIQGIKAVTRIPVAVITNGSLLWDSRVADSLLDADLVIPSLDAGDRGMFQRINRPHPMIDFDRMVAGLAAFGERFRRKMWLEVMLLEGLNDDEEQVAKIAEIADSINPERVQLNTAVRPPAEDYVHPVAAGRLRKLGDLFPLPVDIIASAVGAPGYEVSSQARGHRDEILAMLRRRPCTADDVARGLGLHRLSALKELEALAESNIIRRQERDGRGYYLPADGDASEG